MNDKRRKKSVGVGDEFWLGRWGGGDGEASLSPSPSSPSQYSVSISKRDRSSSFSFSSPSSSSSFVSSVYDRGDPCDLLEGKPRTTEVRFVCHEQPPPTTRPSAAPAAAAPQQQQQQASPQPQPTQQIVQPPPNVLLSAKELSTCRYEVVVGLAGLCGHADFEEEEPEAATIECCPAAVVDVE